MQRFITSVAAATLVFAGFAQAGHNKGCEPSCGGGGLLAKLCAQKSCCEPEPCCAPEPTCGCEAPAPAPSCGCEAAPEPTCGCEAPAPAPSCGCEAAPVEEACSSCGEEVVHEHVHTEGCAACSAAASVMVEAPATGEIVVEEAAHDHDGHEGHDHAAEPTPAAPAEGASPSDVPPAPEASTLRAPTAYRFVSFRR